MYGRLPSILLNSDDSPLPTASSSLCFFLPPNLVNFPSFLEFCTELLFPGIGWL